MNLHHWQSGQRHAREFNGIPQERNPSLETRDGFWTAWSRSIFS